jgi:hypothetical protein
MSRMAPMYCDNCGKLVPYWGQSFKELIGAHAQIAGHDPAGLSPSPIPSARDQPSLFATAPTTSTEAPLPLGKLLAVTAVATVLATIILCVLSESEEGYDACLEQELIDLHDEIGSSEGPSAMDRITAREICKKREEAGL